MSAKTKDCTYFIFHEGDACHVTKAHPDGSFGTTHTVHNGICDCEAFHFNKTCSHVEKAQVKSVEGDTTTLDEAREIVQQLVASFGDLYEIELPVEPYERTEDGKVSGITLVLKNGAENAVFRKGTWSARLRKSGVKCTLIVT